MESNTNFVTQWVIPAIASVAMWILGYIKGRPKDRADITSTLIESAKNLVSIAEGISNAQQGQLLKQDAIILQQKENIIQLTTEGSNCRKTLRIAQESVNRMQSIVDDYRSYSEDICNKCKLIKDEAKNITGAVNDSVDSIM